MTLSAAGTVQLQLYGADVSVQRSTLFTRNSTFFTPILSDAVAEIATTVPCVTVAAFLGEVIVTKGFVVSGGLGVGVRVGVGVDVRVLVGLGVAVRVLVAVAVRELVGVAVAVGVLVDVLV